MKIAINTINDYLNYGNRLQNYALQEVLTRLGHNVVTLKNYSETPMPILKRISKKIQDRELFTSVLSHLSGEKYRNRMQDELKLEKFNEFNCKYIRESDFVVDLNTDNFSFDNDFDCYVIGSDQVWNYNFRRFSKLDFISYSCKPKISYAASFGVSTIPNELRSTYRKGLNSLKSISVREDAGQQLVKELSGRDAKLVLDPTLLLEKTEWQSLIKSEPQFSEKYILTYFLNEPKKEDKEYIQRLADRTGLRVKSLADRTDQKMWVTNPIEFVNLFSQADKIVTDSFHACVFSIIFSRNFEVFERNYNGPSMNSRIDTLLGLFGLKNRVHNSLESKENINYEPVQKKLGELRTQSLDFLVQSLNEISA